MNLLFSILIVLLIFIYYPILSNIDHFENQSKPIIWLYWEGKEPNYIKLCYKTVLKHCTDDFNIIRLNENTVFDYLPEFKNKNFDEFLNIPQKSDVFRYNLLYKYGGIWLDSDIIVFSSLKSLFDKLKTYDYVGAGCHTKKCTPNGSPYPANWIMMSRPNTKLMKLMVDKTKNINSKINYHGIGRNLLWKNIAILKKKYNWTYYHIPSQCFERDSNDNKYTNKRLISKEKYDSKCKNLIFIPIYNTAPGFPIWFKKLSEKEILNSDLLISILLNKSLRQ